MCIYIYMCVILCMYMDYIHMHKSGHALPRTPAASMQCICGQLRSTLINWRLYHQFTTYDIHIYIYTIIIYVYIYIYTCISGWWYTYPLKKIWLRQLGWWNSHEWKYKINVPNHQPYIYIYTLDYYTVVPPFRLAWVPQSSSLCGFSSVSKDIRRILGVDPDSTFAGAPVC